MDSIEVYVWLIVFIVLTAIEMATFQLVTIWFAVGAVAAFITSLFSTSLEIQLIVFLAVSMLLLILVRPIAGRFLQTKTVKTNVDSLIGDYATVTARIHNQEGFGKAVIRGQEWTAAAEKDDEIIEAGSHAVIVERLGGYLTTWSVGVHIKMPFVDHVARNVILKEQVVDFDPQPVITKDNVTMLIDTVVFYQITDPKLYAYGVENPLMAIENLTATTLRNIIGEMELDETLTSRETINTKMRSSLDEATDPWGIKVNRVELKNIAPPSDIQNSMEKQAKAERDKRAAILSAEGEKQSAILRAEGKKQSAILDAEAEKQAAILRAEAKKEAMLREAEGEAEAIRRVSQAKADGIAYIKEAKADAAVLQIKSMEAFEKAADGKATKIIVPSNLASIAGTLTALSETVQKDAPES